MLPSTTSRTRNDSSVDDVDEGHPLGRLAESNVSATGSALLPGDPVGEQADRGDRHGEQFRRDEQSRTNGAGRKGPGPIVAAAAAAGRSAGRTLTRRA